MDELRNVLFLSVLHCTGEHGKSARWLRKHGIMARAVCLGEPNYLCYANDYGYCVRLDFAKTLVKEADAVVLEEFLPDAYGLSASELEGKVVVRDAHGTYSRREAVRLLDRWDGRYPTVYRTYDLFELLGEPGGHGCYSPCAVDFSEYPYADADARSARMDSGAPLVVAHAPTNRRIKGTELLLKAMAAMPKTELLLSEHEPNDISLFRRSKANVYFDNIADGSYHGYSGVLGVAGIESAALGQAVLGDFHATPSWESVPQSLKGADELIETLELLKAYPDGRVRRQVEWYQWAREHRSREKVEKEFYGWLCRQSAYSSV